jgi:hypothetical protein
LSNLAASISIEHKQEYAADAIGLALAMELHNVDAQRDSFRTPLIYAGVEFALQVYRVLEDLDFQFDNSHPTAEARLSFIRSEMKKRCNPDSWNVLTSVSTGIDNVFDGITKILKDPTEHDEYYRRQADEFMLELDQLLSQCTGGMVTNYAEFYEKAGRIFERGYPHKMLERVAEVAGDFFATLQDVTPQDERSKNEVWIRFQKFKLLLAFVDQFVNEPARSLFAEALRLPVPER